MKKWTKEQRTQVTLDSKSVAGARELGSRFEIVKIPGGLTLPAPKCGLQNGQGITKFAVRFAWQRNGAFVPTEQNTTPSELQFLRSDNSIRNRAKQMRNRVIK